MVDAPVTVSVSVPGTRELLDTFMSFATPEQQRAVDRKIREAVVDVCMADNTLWLKILKVSEKMWADLFETIRCG